MPAYKDPVKETWYASFYYEDWKRMMVSGVCRPAASSFSQEETIMDFFNSAIEVLQTLVVALGAGLGVWGVINLLEGYGNDNPGANAHVR